MPAKEVKVYGLTAKLKSDSQPGISELVEVGGPGGNVFQFYSNMSAGSRVQESRGCAAATRPCGRHFTGSREADEIL